MKQGIALKKQTVLQKEASEVLIRLDLINILSSYGEVKMVGNVALGLMTWPDKSIADINDMDYFEILKEIFNKKNIKQIILIDNRNPFEKNRPKSMYIGVVYDLEGIDWKVDIRYLNSSDAWAEKHLEQIKAKLSQKKIKTILEIKTAFHNHSSYGKEFSGYDIYKAFLDKGVSTIEEFDNYLKKTGVLLR